MELTQSTSTTSKHTERKEIMEISRKWQVISVGAALTGVGLTGVALADTSTPMTTPLQLRRSVSTHSRTLHRSQPTHPTRASPNRRTRPATAPMTPGTSTRSRNQPTHRTRARTTPRHPRRHPHPSRAMAAVVAATTIPPARAARAARTARTRPETRQRQAFSPGLLGSSGSR